MSKKNKKLNQSFAEDFLRKDVIEKLAQEMLIRELVGIARNLYDLNKGRDLPKIVNKVIDKFKKPNGLSPHILLALQLHPTPENLHARDKLACERIKMWNEKRPDLVKEALDQMFDFAINVRKDFDQLQSLMV